MTRPTPRALWLAAAGLPLSLLPALVRPQLWPLWVVGVFLLCLALGADLLLSPPPSRLELTASGPALLHVGRPAALRLALTLPGAAAVQVACDLGALLEPAPLLEVPLSDGKATAEIALLPHQRGPASAEEAWVRWKGPLGLVWREARKRLSLPLPITLDPTGVREIALRFAGSPLVQAGLKVERVRGEGSEFEALREFAQGMDMRTIDWKASARHRKLLAREHRAERNHQIIAAIDTGHLMRAPLGGLARLDHAIHSALVLSWVGLRTGDRVGVFGFDEGVRCWTEPQGGIQSFARVQQACAALAYSDAETNFTLGLAELATRVRRRSLVVLFTDFADSITAELMLENVDRLRSRHLVLFVALRDPRLDQLSTQVPGSLHDVHRVVLAGELRRERELVLRRLQRMGVHTLDADPRRSPALLVARYLEIKRRELV
jgi:uncharacterized protein (DUF58 family)